MFRWWLENLNVQNIFKMNGVLFVIVQGDFTLFKKTKQSLFFFSFFGQNIALQP